MDKSLDEVRRVFVWYRHSRLTVATQIIATARPKGIRKSNPRRNSGKAQVLGTANAAPAARARAVPASNGARTVPAPTSQQPSDKIIVSNLPPDVNELQVKVSRLFAHVSKHFLNESIGALPHDSGPAQGRNSPLRQCWSLQGCCCHPLPTTGRRDEGISTVQQPID